MKRETALDRELDQLGQGSLYSRLATLISDGIAGGLWKPGDLLPSEKELCSRYNVSRTTVRQALASLEEKKLVQRVHGKGTFVASKKVNRSLNGLYSFTDEMNTLGLTATTKVISVLDVPVPPHLAPIFDLPAEQATVVEIRRVRLVNGETFSYETVYIPKALCPYLSVELLNNFPLYKILNEFAELIPDTAKEVYSAIVLDAETAKTLHTEPGAAGFKVERTTRSAEGRCYEFATIIIRGDLCNYEVSLKSDNISFTRSVITNYA